METFKQAFIAAFAPAARHWALIEGQRHAPGETSRIPARNARRGKRAHADALRRLAFAR